MAFVLKKRVDLSEMDETWKGAYLDFNSPSVAQVQEMAAVKENQNEAAFKMMQDIFIGGMGFNGTELVEIKKEEFLELPVEAMNYAARVITGEVSPN